MKKRAKEKGRPLPDFTKEEFMVWAYEHGFDDLYKTWVQSGFKKDLSPSVDRLDDDKSYIFSNMQLITWEENNQKGNADRKAGKTKHLHKTVLQFDKYYNFIAEYISLNEAERQTGVNAWSISLVCKGKQHTAGGYIWQYK